MKPIFDYAGLLNRQCEIASRSLSGEKSGSSESVFSQVCKRLTKDFLPPIDREDIAALSYAIFDINIKCEENFNSLKGKSPCAKIKKQLDFLPVITSGLLGKKKTCGDDIRRFIGMNLECRKSADLNSAVLNDAFADFIKISHSAFFKNL